MWFLAVTVTYGLWSMDYILSSCTCCKVLEETHCNLHHNSPYSQKRNNYYNSIKFNHTDLIYSFPVFTNQFYQLKIMNQVKNSTESLVISISLLFPLLFDLKTTTTTTRNKQTNKQNFPFGQTYSWNKFGFKLFSFQKYRPYWLVWNVLGISISMLLIGIIKLLLLKKITFISLLI